MTTIHNNLRLLGKGVMGLLSRADVTATFDPSRAGAIAHSGTYNGNAVTMAAGLEALAHYDAAAVARLHETGEALRARLNAAIAQHRLAATVTGHGSLMQLHLSPAPVTRPEDDERADPRDVRLMHLALANRGVFSSTRQLYVVPTVWTAEAEQHFVTAFDAALGVVAASRAARESARVL